MLAVFDRSNNIRFVQATSSILEWAERRGVEAHLVGPADLPTLADRGFKAIHGVVGHDLAYLSSLQSGVKIILDHDIVDPNYPFKNDQILEGRSYAFRRAFGGRTRYEPEIEVPYTHAPNLSDDLLTSSAGRDTLIFDLHKWLPLAAQFSFLGLMQEVGRYHSRHSDALGRKLNIYFTGLIDPEPYRSVTELFCYLNEKFNIPSAFDAPFRKGNVGTERWLDRLAEDVKSEVIADGLKLSHDAANPMDIFIKQVLPVAEGRDDFLRVFSESVGFITDHGDIADQDVTTCLVLGVPVLPIPRSPWRKSAGVGSTLVPAFKHLAPELVSSISGVLKEYPRIDEGIPALMKKHVAEPVPQSLFQSLFDVSWDRLWSWAESGTRDDATSELIASSPTWDFGMA